MSDTQGQPTPSQSDRGSPLSLFVFALVFLGLVAVSQLLPPPVSQIVLVGLIIISMAYGVFGIRLSFGKIINSVVHMRLNIPVPKFLAGVRNLLAAVAAIIAMGLMISAAIDFNPANKQQFLDSGVTKMFLGAAVIGIAVWLSSRLPALAQSTPLALNKPRRFWWVVVGIGVVLLAILSEINGRFLQIEAIREVHINIQYALLMSGIVLVLYGLGGLPRMTLSALRVNRDERLTVIAVIAILALAFFLRVWRGEETVRVLIDELHFSDGLQRITGYVFTSLLEPMSGQSPYSNVFPYWQAAAVQVVGYTWTGFRFVSAICGTLTVLATYGLGRAIFDRKTALLGMLAIATFPPAIHFSRVALLSIADPLFGTMAVMFIARALHRNHRIEWAAAGVSLGLTQYFYEGGRLLFPALVIGWLVVLTIGGHMRGRWRGVVIMVAAFAIIGAPIYYTIASRGAPLFGRMDESGDGRLNEEISDGISINDIVERFQHGITAFMMFGAHEDMSVYYGGDQALVNVVMLPLFLFGAFYLLWRFPSPAFLIPLWIVGAGAGNGLLRDTVVSARYYVVLPALAVAIMAGVRYFLPFLAGIIAPTRRLITEPPADAQFPEDLANAALPARPTILWQVAGAVTTIACIVIAVYHVNYYFGPHLELFNRQVRDYKPYRDGVDVAMRSVELPGNTQVVIAASPEHDQHIPRHWLSFLAQDHGGDPARYLPLITFSSATLNTRYLRDLAPGINYAFFLSPTDQEQMRLIYRQFPNASPPQYSTADTISANREYVLIWIPAW